MAPRKPRKAATPAKAADRTVGIATDKGGRPLVDEGGRPVQRKADDQ